MHFAPQKGGDKEAAAHAVDVLNQAHALNQREACNRHVAENVHVHGGVEQKADEDAEEDTCFLKESLCADGRAEAVVFQSCGDACDDVKAHEDGECFDACVKSSKGFVKEGEADAEDGATGQFGARPCVFDGMDEGLDGCVCVDDDLSPFGLKVKRKPPRIMTAVPCVVLACGV